MKRYLLWSFERGSTQYDVICLIILSFIFLTPESAFNDRPPYRYSFTEEVKETQDDSGRKVYTVQVESPFFASEETRRNSAEDKLRKVVGGAFTILKWEPIYNTIGMPRAYAIWIEK
jgi:hypothetical protein